MVHPGAQQMHGDEVCRQMAPVRGMEALSGIEDCWIAASSQGQVHQSRRSQMG
ncbi:unnamed protein product [Staurois parvus]|uniref:Uncharacterized protein n=1 Tax=Staurois parvus TaxID=386267 RepID=A0ABN9HTS8_9NEOB|nr:unnamed protein product [Staurois parvus]